MIRESPSLYEITCRNTLAYFFMNHFRFFWENNEIYCFALKASKRITYVIKNSTIIKTEVSNITLLKCHFFNIPNILKNAVTDFDVFSLLYEQLFSRKVKQSTTQFPSTLYKWWSQITRKQFSVFFLFDFFIFDELFYPVC